MQNIIKEFSDSIDNSVKAGYSDKPRCIVEVDRYVFVPGRTEEVDFATDGGQSQISVTDSWIDGSDGTTTLGYQQAVFPVAGKSLDNMTSGFGARGSGYHSGIDIGASVGTDVYAVYDGTVVKATTESAYKDYGYYVDIQHLGGIVTRYGHLSSILVKKGDIVSQGQIIGKVGNTGNVRSNGNPVTGSYSDPNSERSKGLGSHLHFEVRLPDNKGGTVAVDPVKYLDGTNKLYTSSTNSGSSVVVGGTANGVPGEIRLNETFVDRDWYTKSNYIVDANFKQFAQTGSASVVGSTGKTLTFMFDPQKVSTNVTTGFDINVVMNNQGILNLGFFAILGSQDKLNIYINDKLVRSFSGFDGKYQEIKNTYVPQGNNTVRIEVSWTRGNSKQYIAFSSLFIQEIVPYTSSKPGLVPTRGEVWDNPNIEQFVFQEGNNKIQLQVGQFVYMDTLRLDNVMGVEIDNQFEMECSEATLTLSNYKGMYSPDYDPYNFPDEYMSSPWSYYANGFRVSVLNENTTLRIYMGYGQNLIRVFTGLIDKVTMTADGQMTVSCRDMYKKAVETVLRETKAYPKAIDPDDIFSINGSDIGTGGGTDRRSIIASAIEQASKFGIDYRFLLAICQHETVMGTAGWGVPEKGSYVLGYGVYSNNSADPAYAGVDKQMYYGAKRVYEALRSRNWKIDDLSDVEYFRIGGDKGTQYTWSPDTNWDNAVWGYYQNIIAHPEDWSLDSTGGEIAQGKVAWLKSAVVQDLAEYAGLRGWRVNATDMLYPDMVIEESYLIETDQQTGMIVKAVPGVEGAFVTQPASSIMTPQGWMNPFVEDYGKTFNAYSYKVADCIAEVIKDTNYRVYCDRYGTFRMEQIKYDTPAVYKYTERENLVSLSKTIDYSRARSHLVVSDGNGKTEHFIDKELLLELKGEVRTATVNIPWATSSASKRQVAARIFFDMKRLSRTLQAEVVANPALDVMDNVLVEDRVTGTKDIYTIKGIHTSFSVDSGFTQTVDLTWFRDNTVV